MHFKEVEIVVQYRSNEVGRFEADFCACVCEDEIVLKTWENQ